MHRWDLRTQPLARLQIKHKENSVQKSQANWRNMSSVNVPYRAWEHCLWSYFHRRADKLPCVMLCLQEHWSSILLQQIMRVPVITLPKKVQGWKGLSKGFFLQFRTVRWQMYRNEMHKKYSLFQRSVRANDNRSSDIKGMRLFDDLSFIWSDFKEEMK